MQRIEAESKSLPEKIKEVNVELAELTRKVPPSCVCQLCRLLAAADVLLLTSCC